MTDSDAKAASVAAQPPKKAREGRSPGFPFVDLKKALERAETFRQVEGKHLVPVASAAKAWKLGEETAAGRRTVAALGHFGLFSGEGAGEDRKVKLTDLALKILLDKQPVSQERDKLIQSAALLPAIHKELWGKWKNELPSDATIETYLVRDREFSSVGALDLIAEYRNTLAFAKLLQSGNKLPSDNRDEGGGNDLGSEIEVGDLVNVERAGALVFPKPVRVREIRENDGQIWVWTDGADSWTEMETVELVNKGSGAERATPPALPRLPFEARAFPSQGTRKEVFALDEGDVVLTFPGNLSPASYDDLEAYLGVFLKKAKRLATALSRPAGEAKKPEWADKKFSPGDTVPASTPFRTHHTGHGGRLLIELEKGETFPACDKCSVTYTLA
jgi:hypothetical protein